MAVDQPSPSLTQAIRSVRWIVNSLNHPLASLTVPLDGLDWDDATLPLVGFDPLAQFSPPVAPEQATTDEARSARSAQPVWPSPPLSPSEFSQGFNQPSVANSITAPTTPVFSLRPRSSGAAARSPSNPPVTWLDPSNSVSQAVQRPLQNHGVESQPEQNAASAEAQSSGKSPFGDRSQIPQFAGGASLPEWSSVPFSSTSVEAAIAETTTQVTTVTLIEQVVNQLLSGSDDMAAATASASSAPMATAYSTTSPVDLMSFHSSTSSSSRTTSSASVPLPIARSVLDLMSGNWMEGLAQSAIAPTSQASDFNTGFDDVDFASLNAETPLAEMAETLTLLVNDVLTEQARRHGVDLS